MVYCLGMSPPGLGTLCPNRTKALTRFQGGTVARTPLTLLGCLRRYLPPWARARVVATWHEHLSRPQRYLPPWARVRAVAQKLAQGLVLRAAPPSGVERLIRNTTSAYKR